MPEAPPDHRVVPQPSLSEQVGEKAVRKIQARQHAVHAVWSGLGMMGLIGWSVAIPTLAGAALGIWLDRHYPGTHAWTLALLVGGLSLGCLNAWHWVVREERAMHEDEEDEGG